MGINESCSVTCFVRLVVVFYIQGEFKYDLHVKRKKECCKELNIICVKRIAFFISKYSWHFDLRCYFGTNCW